MNRAPRPTRCYYEVLDVPRDVSPEDLKSTYRKLVLVWHPDKNPHRIEEATDRFKEIQNAYTILNDPNERAWYDNHRESILKGSEEGEEASQGINLWPYFSTNCFWGYGDDDEGFYGVYRKVFETLDAEERDAVSDNKSEPYRAAPSFGNSKTPYAEVKRFYTHWKEFTSRKSFGWAEKYNPSEAPNRQVRRLIEKENKKSRDEKKKEFVQNVRHLAQIVQRLDKRVLEGQQTEQLERAEREKEAAALQKQRQLEKKKRQQEAREKWAQEHVDEEHEKMLEMLARDEDDDEEEEHDEEDEKKSAENKNEDDAEDKEQLVAEEKSGNDDDDEEIPKKPAKNTPQKPAIVKGKEKKKKSATDLQELYCAACRKKFKSDSQWRNHEQSKKHKEAVERLRYELRISEDEAEDENEHDDANPEGDDDEEEIEIQEKKQSSASTSDRSVSKTTEKLGSLSLGAATPKSTEDNSKKTAAAASSESKSKNSPAPKPQEKKKEKKLAAEAASNEDDLLLLASFAKKKATVASLVPTMAEADDDDDGEEEENSKAKSEPKKTERPRDTQTKKTEKVDAEEDEHATPAEEKEKDISEDDEQGDDEQPKDAKAKRKPRRRNKDEKAKAPAPAAEFVCTVCKTQCDTRNQLFTHIRQTGHARAPGHEDTKATAATGKKKR